MIPDTIRWWQTLQSFEFGCWFSPLNWKLERAFEAGMFTGHGFVQVGPLTLGFNYVVLRK